jgi:hypothetical protein
MKQDEPYELPDWAPDDTGSILIQDGDWLLIKDYLFDSREPMATVVHLCDGMPWKLTRSPPTLMMGRCDKCRAKPPETFEGFCQLVAWKR